MSVNHWNQQNLNEKISNFSVSIVPADGQAPLGAGTSAGKVITESNADPTYIPEWHLKGVSKGYQGLELLSNQEEDIQHKKEIALDTRSRCTLYSMI